MSITSHKSSITITEDTVIQEPIQLTKGELIYVKPGAWSVHLFKKISSGDLNFGNASDSGNTVTDLLDIRKSIAHISPDIYLWSEMTASENVEMYTASIGMNYPSSKVSSLCNKLGLDENLRVEDMTAMQQHLLRLIIGLAKEPDLILYANPLSQIDTSTYKNVMNVLYDEVINKGITLISCIGHKDICALFPGRHLNA